MHTRARASSSLTYAYAYDRAGNLVSVTDKDGSTEAYAYDFMDREIRRTAKDNGVWETLYDKNGNVAKRTSPMQYLSDKRGYTYSYDLCSQGTGWAGKPLKGVRKPTNMMNATA